MSSKLLAIAVGPVQDFIAAARRTRDLWFGSHLLSELSKAAAAAVAHEGGELIFPAPTSSASLAPGSDLIVANVILAELPESVSPEVASNSAKVAVSERWHQFADGIRDTYSSVINREIWDEQVDDVVECFAVWTAMASTASGTPDYRGSRQRLMRLLAGRKACRDFQPAKGHRGIPKSSLDGLRESVLKDPLRTARSHYELRLNTGEQLDVIGVVKRTSPADRYPSVSRVAADPWLRGCSSEQLESLNRACESLPRGTISRIDTRVHRSFATFPFDGSVIYRSRHREIQKEHGLAIDLEPLKQTLRSILRDRPEPSPYLAVLVADGDRMGELISRLDSPRQHRELSQALSQFADAAIQIVQAHFGVLVYAGGDDVLAFLPVDQALRCARQLHDEFSRALQPSAAGVCDAPTLSVGIAIAHFMEPMEDLLEYGRKAEKHAKHPRNGAPSESRNGLAIHVAKRSGSPIEVRAQWSAEGGGLDARLDQLADWINSGAISGRVAYDLRRLADFYRGWPIEKARQVIKRDTFSVLESKSPRGESRIDSVRQFIDHFVDDASGLQRLAEELIVARMLAEAKRQVGEDTEVELAGNEVLL